MEIKCLEMAKELDNSPLASLRFVDAVEFVNLIRIYLYIYIFL